MVERVTAAGPSRRAQRTRRPPRRSRPSPSPEGNAPWNRFTPEEGDGDVAMRAQEDEDDSSPRIPAFLNEDDDSADEYRPSPTGRRKGKSRQRTSTRRNGSASSDSSGEELSESEASPDAANMFVASQQAPTTDSQRLDRARRNQWRPPVGHGGLEGLETWREVGNMHRRRRAAEGGDVADEDAEDVEVEAGELQSLADAFAGVTGGGVDGVLPVAQVEEWQRALHVDEDPDEEMDEVAFENDMRAAAGFRRRRARAGEVNSTGKKKRQAAREQALAPEVRDLMTQANVAYVEANLDDAIAKLQEVIRIEPAVRSAWSTLAVCFGELGQPSRQLQCRIMAAHLTAHPLQTWIELADESRALHYNEQAVYCLARAISSSEENDRSDVLDVMWQRAQLLEELNDVRRAAKGYLRMLSYRPQNQGIIRAVVPLLYDLQMFDKAVDVLQRCADWNMAAFPDPIVNPTLLDAEIASDNRATYESSEVVTLVDLLLRLDRPQEALSAVRKGARWLQGRGSETFWDEMQADDREFDLDRNVGTRTGDYGRRVNFAPVHDLDPEFRFRLGRIRARLGDVSEARLHFGIWQAGSDVLDHPQQYGDLVDEYINLGTLLDDGDDGEEEEEEGERGTQRSELFTEALHITLRSIERFEELEVHNADDDALLQLHMNEYKRAARCYMGLNMNAQAVQYLEEIVAFDPDDLENKLRLAEVQEDLGHREAAFALVREVVQAKQALRAQEVQSGATAAAAATLAQQNDETLPQSLSFFVEMTERGRGGAAAASSSVSASVARQTSREDAVQMEALREAEAVATLKKAKAREQDVFIDRWWHPDVPMAGDPRKPIYGNRESADARRARFAHVSEWLGETEGLVTMFCNTQQLFLKDKSKRFFGMFRRHRRRGDAVDRQARALLTRMGDQLLDEDRLLRGVEHHTFRGIALNEWVNILMRYAFVLTKIGDFAAAKQVIGRVMRSNVVWSDDERRLSLSMCLASCALYAGHYQTAVSDAALRALPYTYQFHNEALRLLGVVSNASGYAVHKALGSTNNLKFFLRRSRIHEALVQGAKCAFSTSMQRWVVRDQLFESTLATEAGDRNADESGDEEGEGEEEDDDESSDGLAAATASSTVLARKRKLSTRTSTAHKIWTEIQSMPDMDHARLKPPTRYNPANDMFYAGLLLTSSNGIPSMAYWLRIVTHQACDALVCLACAVACLGRASNRQVDNRHQVIVEAFAFLAFYRQIRRRERAHRRRQLNLPPIADVPANDEAEVRYNFGRAAHHMGLYQLAVPQYRAVLEREEQARKETAASNASAFDCIVESAFSLHLIYIASGNPLLANAVLERHLRV